MEFSAEHLGQIVSDIWTSMLGFPVQARSAPAEMNGTRHLSASVQISGGWDGTVFGQLRRGPGAASGGGDVRRRGARRRTTRSATPSARSRT